MPSSTAAASAGSPSRGGRAAALLLGALLAACSPQRDSTPLPTRQTTVDPVLKKLDAAAEQAEKRRQDLDAAAK
jgi:hypothetical protein